jgi:type II secretory pathway component PulJ
MKHKTGIGPKRNGQRGFTTAEVIVALTLFTTLSAALFMGATSLQRSFSATTDFAINHADQMRISDYLSLDLRRAVGVTAAPNDTRIQIPAYYDVDKNPVEPTLDGHGGVNYGTAGTFVEIHYYLSNGVIYRKEGSDPALELATNVADFSFNITDLGKVVSTQITFAPQFRSRGASAAAIAATTFYNTTLLRNSRRDMVSTVY